MWWWPNRFLFVFISTSSRPTATGRGYTASSPSPATRCGTASTPTTATGVHAIREAIRVPGTKQGILMLLPGATRHFVQHLLLFIKVQVQVIFMLTAMPLPEEPAIWRGLHSVPSRHKEVNAPAFEGLQHHATPAFDAVPRGVDAASSLLSIDARGLHPRFTKHKHYADGQAQGQVLCHISAGPVNNYITLVDIDGDVFQFELTIACTSWSVSVE